MIYNVCLLIVVLSNLTYLQYLRLRNRNLIFRPCHGLTSRSHLKCNQRRCEQLQQLRTPLPIQPAALPLLPLLPPFHPPPLLILLLDGIEKIPPAVIMD